MRVSRVNRHFWTNWCSRWLCSVSGRANLFTESQRLHWGSWTWQGRLSVMSLAILLVIRCHGDFIGAHYSLVPWRILIYCVSSSQVFNNLWHIQPSCLMWGVTECIGMRNIASRDFDFSFEPACQDYETEWHDVAFWVPWRRKCVTNMYIEGFRLLVWNPSICWSKSPNWVAWRRLLSGMMSKICGDSVKWGGFITHLKSLNNSV